MQRFKNILFVMEPDYVNVAALARALASASALAVHNQACLTVVQVIDEIPNSAKLVERVLLPEDLQAKIVANHLKRLKEQVTPWKKTIKIQTKVLVGTPFLETIRNILRNEHDLVIKAAEQSDLLNRILGSNDMHLLRKCPCPVWLLKPKSPKDCHCILAAVDVDYSFPPTASNTKHQLNLQTLEMASSLALSESAQLHIINAWEASGESMLRSALVNTPEQQVDRYVEEVQQKHRQNLQALIDEALCKLAPRDLEYIAPKTHLIKGLPGKEIPMLVDKIAADLVVMGTVARTGIPGFIIGNTAETILNQINCSVLAVKPPGFVTPVA